MTWHRNVQQYDNVFVTVEAASYYACVDPAPRTLEALRAVAQTFAATYPWPQSEATPPAHTWKMAEIAPVIARATGDAERWAIEVGTPTGYFVFNAAGALTWSAPGGGTRVYNSPRGAA